MSTTMFKSTKNISTKKVFSPKPYRIRLPMLLPIKSSKQLLQDHRVTHILPQLQQLAYTTEEKYNHLYLGALNGFAEYVQQLPSRRNFHFNHTNGSLLLGLLRAFQTMRLYREQTPVKSYGRDKVPANIALWSYALYTAALFLGVGEIYATYWISLCDAHGEYKQRWQPKSGPMTQYEEITHYRYSFETETRDAIAHLDTLVVAEKMLPKEGLAWIASDKYVYELWSAILTGDHGRAGPFAGFILPSEDIVLEQHQDLIESLEDFLLHQERKELAEQHQEELVVELAQIDSLDDLNPAQQKEIKENENKKLINLPDGKMIYVDLSNIVGPLSGDKLFAVVLNAIGGVMNYQMGSFVRMVASGLAISASMMEIFAKAFPEHFTKLNRLGTTFKGELVSDPTLSLNTLPRQVPLNPQDALIPNAQAGNNNSYTPRLNPGR